MFKIWFACFDLKCW